MKKIISYLLVFAMLFSLAVPVSAKSFGETVHDVIEYLSPAYAFIDFIKSGKPSDLLESVSPAYSLYDVYKDIGAKPDISFYPLQYAIGGSGDLNFYGGASSSGANVDIIYSGKNSDTSYYKAIDPVQNIWYNPVTYNYSSSVNMSFSPKYSTYYIEDNNYKSYVIDNTTYVSYYIIENTESETPSTWYYEIYYQLPDGRYSYDLTAEDVWGTYFLYDAVNYDEVVEDDGTTLALLHFDGNILDSSAHNNAVNYTANASYNFIDSDFTSALSWSDSTAHSMTVALPEPLSGDFTIEGKIKISDSSSNDLFYVGPDGKNVNLTPHSYSSNVSLATRKAYIESRLGTGGTYETDSSTGFLYYYKYGNYIQQKNGLGTGVLFLNDFNLFKGNDSLKNNLSGVKAYTSSYDAYKDIYFTRITPVDSVYSYSQILDEIFSFAFVRSGDIVTYFENGLAKHSFDYAEDDCQHLTFQSTNNQSIVFDELRVSNKALYMDTYTPSSQPFDTNLVLVLPDQGEVNQIAVKSNTAVADLRVGGVRPTYPSNGDVYVYLEDDVVKAVEQYQTDGWYSVDACIYEEDTGWTSLANYNLSAYVSEAPADNPDNPGGSGSEDPDNPGGSGSGDLNLGTDGILGELISAVFGGVVEAITAALKGLLSIFTALIEFTTGFGSFLGSAFVFIPGEIISVITAGITLMVVLAVIRFIRG